MAMLSIGEVAERTGISVRTIRRYVSEGRVVPARGTRGKLFFTPDDMDAIANPRRNTSDNTNHLPDNIKVVIAVVNNKGGVAKTTTASNLAWEWTQMGYRVLAIDLDPQASLTDIARGPIDTGVERVSSFIEYIDGRKSISDLIIKTAHFDIIPSDIELALTETNIEAIQRANGKLNEAIAELSGYDIIIIDTPPNLAILTQLALQACQYIIVPVQASYLAMEGTSNLHRYFTFWSRIPNIRSKEIGIVVTMYAPNEAMSRVVLKRLSTEAFSRDLLFDTIVRRARAIENAQAKLGPIGSIDPKSYGAIDYHNLAREILVRVSQTTVA